MPKGMHVSKPTFIPKHKCADCIHLMEKATVSKHDFCSARGWVIGGVGFWSDYCGKFEGVQK